MQQRHVTAVQRASDARQARIAHATDLTGRTWPTRLAPGRPPCPAALASRDEICRGLGLFKHDRRILARRRHPR